MVSCIDGSAISYLQGVPKSAVILVEHGVEEDLVARCAAVLSEIPDGL